MFDELFGDDEAPKLALAANLGYYGDDPDRLWWVFYALAEGGYLASGGTYIRGGSGALSRSLVGVVEAEGGAAQANRVMTEIMLDAHGRAMGVAHTAADGSDRVEDHAPVLFGNAAPDVLALRCQPRRGRRFLPTIRTGIRLFRFSPSRWDSLSAPASSASPTTPRY